MSKDNPKIEEKNLYGPNSNFGLLRAQENYPSRRPKKRLKPPANPVPILAMPDFDPPGILIGKPVGAPFLRIPAISTIDGQTFDPVSYNHYYNRFDTYAFLRLLAKIALASVYTTSEEYNPDLLEPYLSDFILGRKPELGGYLIGGAWNEIPALVSSAPEERHIVQMNVLGGPRLMVCAIKLFCKYNTPQYSVVVGKFSGPVQPVRYATP